MSTPDRPVLRRLEVHPVADGPQRGLLLVDPLGLTAGTVFVPEGLLPVLERFDGVRTVAAIREELESEIGRAVPAELLAKLVGDLDEHLLLLSPRFRRALADEVARFAGAAVRPARHAGSAGYPAEPAALRDALAAMVTPHRAALRTSPRGLIAPHVDLARGREGYAQSYGYLAESSPADLYVVLGTGHQGPGAAVTGLAADWETPIGSVATDREFVATVHARLGRPDPADLFLHRQEHSLEFQMLFLSHVLAGREVRVAGFLTGPLGDDAERVLDAFRAAEAASGQRVCYVAGADLAHLGPRFGDAEPVDRARLERLYREERARLRHLEEADPRGFRNAVEAGGNPDRVCSAVPIYLAAELAGGRAELLHYGQAPAPDGSQLVSFCSMAWEGGAR